ncbi:MAG: bifunctional phosphoglucose/phosphomannose isomerase [Candidatus Aenigmarchaeota archaeon]|nr:bifunctional phosphoglucose/phosphomannose isomerase [Candidatus Aenigmarchaeota archaeon]
MEKTLQNFGKQCESAQTLGRGIRVSAQRVLIAGVGGSAFAGDVLRTVAQEADVYVHRDYGLPRLGKDALVFAVSYSGNTEETLSALQQAIQEKRPVVGISSGGKLEELCLAHHTDHIKIPAGVQPRNALGYLIIPMLNVLEENGIVGKQELGGLRKELEDPAIRKEGKRIAALLEGKTPLIYSSERMACLSYGWKTRVNENAKVHAFAHRVPELNHNELVGYTKKIGNFYTLMIRDREDSTRVRKRFDATKKMIEELGGECCIVDTRGSGLLSRVFNTLHIGDWASYELALRYGVDPEPVHVIERFKKELGS